jgi:hypothetical protein
MRRRHLVRPGALRPRKSSTVAIVFAVKLSAAGTRARTGDALERVHLAVGHRARGVRAHGLEDILDRHVAAAEAAGAIEPL